MTSLPRFLTIGFLLCSLSGLSQAKDAPMTLDQLPVSESFSPRALVVPDQNAEAQATFVAEVAGKVKGLGYRITDQRTLKEIYDRVSSEGPAYNSVWRLPEQQTIALSQSFDLDDGKVLVGYVMLEKQ